MRREIVMRAALAGLLLGTLGACASTEMRSYLGKPADELLIAYGRPENIIDLEDGSKAYQFRWGGGSVIIPGHTTATVTSLGNSAMLNASTTPSTVVNSEGCLITYIITKRGESYVVSDYRVPKKLVC